MKNQESKSLLSRLAEFKNTPLSKAADQLRATDVEFYNYASGLKDATLPHFRKIFIELGDKKLVEYTIPTPAPGEHTTRRVPRAQFLADVKNAFHEAEQGNLYVPQYFDFIFAFESSLAQVLHNEITAIRTKAITAKEPSNS